MRRAQEVVEHALLPARERAGAELLGHHGADVVGRALLEPEQGRLVGVAPVAHLVLELVEELVRRRRIAVAMAVHDAGLCVDSRDVQAAARPAARDGGHLPGLLIGERELLPQDAAVVRIGGGHVDADGVAARDAELFLRQAIEGRGGLLDIGERRAAALDVDGTVVVLEMAQEVVGEPLGLRQKVWRMVACPARAQEQGKKHKGKEFLHGCRLTSAASGRPRAQRRR